MRTMPLMIAAAIAATAVGIVAYSKARAPGADIRIFKTSSVTPAPMPKGWPKDQSRIPPEE